MPQLRDFLSRFRPAGAPGEAARAGVPADREAELAAEAGPVLALLDGTWAECERICAQARRDAAATVAAASAEASAIAADGERRARTARDDAARELADAADRDAAAMLAAAGQQAVRIRALAGQRMPALVRLAIRDIRGLLAEER